MSPVQDSWTYFTNHTHVLLYLATRENATLREVAQAVGITERAAQGIVADLCTAKVIQRERRGRRNHYQLDLSTHLRHPLEAHVTIGEVLSILASKPSTGGGETSPQP